MSSEYDARSRGPIRGQWRAEIGKTSGKGRPFKVTARRRGEGRVWYEEGGRSVGDVRSPTAQLDVGFAPNRAPARKGCPVVSFVKNRGRAFAVTSTKWRMANWGRRRSRGRQGSCGLKQGLALSAVWERCQWLPQPVLPLNTPPNPGPTGLLVDGRAGRFKLHVHSTVGDISQSTETLCASVERICGARRVVRHTSCRTLYNKIDGPLAPPKVRAMALPLWACPGCVPP